LVIDIYSNTYSNNLSLNKEFECTDS
jgi:hypothetical protein